MPDEPRFDKPRLQDALVLLGASAVCAGLFYLFLGKLAEALFYGALVGCGLAAIGAEFVKFIRSYRAEHGAGKVSGAGDGAGDAGVSHRLHLDLCDHPQGAVQAARGEDSHLDRDRGERVVCVVGARAILSAVNHLT